jgi:hypothetical protein
LSETKTNFKNQLKLVASLILTFSLPFLPHYQNHLNAPGGVREGKNLPQNGLNLALELSRGPKIDQ